jgi:hypothetical protein
VHFRILGDLVVSINSRVPEFITLVNVQLLFDYLHVWPDWNSHKLKMASNFLGLTRVAVKIFLVREPDLESSSHTYSTQDQIDGFLTLQVPHDTPWYGLSIRLEGKVIPTALLEPMCLISLRHTRSSTPS